jgi:hypothetical protein
VLKKVITWAIAIFVVYFLATQPSSAASLVHTWFNGLRDIGTSLSHFVTSL